MLPNLDEAKLRFTEWRQNKKNSREPIPKELWVLAVELTKTHSQQEVSKVLGLNSSTLCKKRKQVQSQSSPTPNKHASPKFVELNASSCQNMMTSTRIEIERNDGHRMRLFASVEHPFEVKDIIQHFIGGSNDPSQRSEQNLFGH